MSKKIILSICGGITLLVGLVMLFEFHGPSSIVNTSKLEARILATNDNEIIVQDKDNVIYTFGGENIDTCGKENILLEYTGILDKNTYVQDVTVINCNSIEVSLENGIPSDWQDNGIFSKYYNLAYNQMKKLSLDEKIAQILLVRYPDNNQKDILAKYQFAGYVFFEKDFRNKTKIEVQNMINDLQKVANIPILTAVDEEGGSVVRVSSNTNLIDERFASPSTLYNQGGFALIKEDTIKKSNLLKSLGLNLNLAPVVDVSTNNSSYMYNRTLQQNTELTATYAKTVIEASHNTGVSYTLKHFPGYGNNSDTHLASVTDTRSYDDIIAQDIPPFASGIEAKAEAVLISHNIVNALDNVNPASLSPSVHNLLRNRLGFTGIVITDDLDMSAVNSITDVAVKAILAGNDLIISTNYLNDIRDIKNALNNGTLSEDMIEKLAMRVIAWKYYKGLMFENQK